ncbi:unnamed protein product [Linum trigynum]|uniref:Reverse transcriptase domain-containing protein n=1 Tax=Linum trigynum TaxID=586398 RepID=A0AAV2ERH7_9ROSI
MRILSWNYRGFGQSLTRSFCGRLCRQFGPSVLFLMETKKDELFMEEKRRSLKFDFGMYVNPTEEGSGLALWWKADVDVRLLDKCKSYMDVSIRKEGIEFFCTFFHAPTTAVERRRLWDRLTIIRSSPEDSWLIVGDLNVALHPFEKQGRCPLRNENVDPFKYFISQNGLIDLGFTGQVFTWTNNQLGNDLVRERLDRGLCSVAWRLCFGEAMVHHEEFVSSDHCPIRIDLHPKKQNGKTPFRFDKRWRENGECNQIIGEVWEQGGRINDLLDKCRTNLQNWSVKDRTNKIRREKEIRRRLQDIQGPTRNQEMAEEEKHLRQELETMWKLEEEFWQQRSRNSWLQEGDQNTGFFHASTIKRSSRNRIAKLKDETGLWIHDEQILEDHVNEFYGNLFTTRSDHYDQDILEGFPKMVSLEDNDSLCAEFQKEEIRNAVFQLGASKAPGPDGFPGHFFRRYWSLVGDLFCSEIVSFFNTSTMPPNWNETFITLIPKVDAPEFIGQFRPISCCNFRYKVITKILANRLHPLLPNLVNELQATFTGGRLIQDNIVIVHEVLNHFKKNKTGTKKNLMMKLDMRKAYDLVEWDSLIELLKAYGFNERWCGWIKTCITTVRFKILFNGNPTEEFTPSRGIRQGDPISPSFSY